MFVVLACSKGGSCNLAIIGCAHEQMPINQSESIEHSHFTAIFQHVALWRISKELVRKICEQRERFHAMDQLVRELGGLATHSEDESSSTKSDVIPDTDNDVSVSMYSSPEQLRSGAAGVEGGERSGSNSGWGSAFAGAFGMAGRGLEAARELLRDKDLRRLGALGRFGRACVSFSF